MPSYGNTLVSFCIQAVWEDLTVLEGLVKTNDLHIYEDNIVYMIRMVYPRGEIRGNVYRLYIGSGLYWTIS